MKYLLNYGIDRIFKPARVDSCSGREALVWVSSKGAHIFKSISFWYNQWGTWGTYFHQLRRYTADSNYLGRWRLLASEFADYRTQKLPRGNWPQCDSTSYSRSALSGNRRMLCWWIDIYYSMAIVVKSLPLCITKLILTCSWTIGTELKMASLRQERSALVIN